TLSSTQPGLIVLSVIPRLASATAKYRTNTSMAALAAPMATQGCQLPNRTNVGLNENDILSGEDPTPWRSLNFLRTSIALSLGAKQKDPTPFQTDKARRIRSSNICVIATEFSLIRQLIK